MIHFSRWPKTRRIAAVLCLLAPVLIWAQTVLTGPVNHISDGDTIVVGTVRVRLYGIDAPETDQPYGDTAAQFVTEYLQDVRRVRVVVHDTDRFGRIVGEVFVPGREESLNHALVGAGYAWWYEYFAPEEDGLQMLQEKARQYNRGLWSRDDPVPPWEWRKQ